MGCDGRLPDALAGSGDGDRWKLEGEPLRRVEAEVGANVREAVREHAAGQRESFDWPEDGLIGEVDHKLGAVLLDRSLDIGAQGNPVLLSPRSFSSHRRAPLRRTQGSSASASRTTA
jgi:hypothetical protein